MKKQQTDLASIKTAYIVYDNTANNRIAVKITAYGAGGAMLYGFISPNDKAIGLKADKTGEALRIYNHVKQSPEFSLRNTDKSEKYYHEFYMKG